MATSNNTIWQLTRDELINSSLRKLTVLAEGESASADQIATAIPALNGLISTFQTLGMFLWKRAELNIPFVLGQSLYTIGVGQTTNTANPVKVLQATVEFTSESSIDMELVPFYNYNLLPLNSTGLPIKGSYQPKNDVGLFYVWPKPDASAVANNSLTLTYQKPFDVFTSGTETADFPREWANALIYGLSDLLSDEYGLPLEDRRHLEKRASKWLMAALEGASEETSMFFFPDRRE